MVMIAAAAVRACRSSETDTVHFVTHSLGGIVVRQLVNPILSLLIPGTDDGKVSIESARLEGMKDFRVIPATHPFIMNNKLAITQTLAFLAEGKFASG